MNEPTIRAAFDEWWRESYGVPPGTHAVMTHTAFAAHILQLLELMQTALPTQEVVMAAYRRWWENEGSGMPPQPDDDCETHAARITEIAWSNGAYVMRHGVSVHRQPESADA